jgi:adiponectin receptor
MSRQRKQHSSVQTELVDEAPVTPLPEKFEYYRPKLLSFDELAEWQKDSPFILRGYRPESNSAHACFASWLYLHNETVNIYSHLLPGILFLAGEAMIYQYFEASYPMATIPDRLIFAFFLLTAVTCFCLSAMFHTFLSHSPLVSHIWLQLDFVGIIVLTFGDFVSGIYVGFYCEPGLQKVYFTMVHVMTLY